MKKSLLYLSIFIATIINAHAQQENTATAKLLINNQTITDGESLWLGLYKIAIEGDAKDEVLGFKLSYSSLKSDSSTLVEIDTVIVGNTFLFSKFSTMPSFRSHSIQISDIQAQNSDKNTQPYKNIVVHMPKSGLVQPSEQEIMNYNRLNEHCTIAYKGKTLADKSLSLKKNKPKHLSFESDLEIVKYEIILVRGKRPVAKKEYSSNSFDLSFFYEKGKPGDYLLIGDVKLSDENEYPGFLVFLKD